MAWDPTRINNNPAPTTAAYAAAPAPSGVTNPVPPKPPLTVEGFWRAAGLGEYRPLTRKQIKIAGGF